MVVGRRRVLFPWMAAPGTDLPEQLDNGPINPNNWQYGRPLSSYGVSVHPPVASPPTVTADAVAPVGWPNYQTTTATVARPAAPPPYASGSDPQWEAQLRQLQAEQAQVGARRNVTSATGELYNAQETQQGFREATLGANREVLGARANQSGAARQVIGANRGVVAATGRTVEGNASLVRRQQQENEQQRQEYQAEVAAANNVQDQAAVARFKRHRAITDSRLRQLGITPEVDVNVPVGFEGRLAPGTRAAATTQAEDVARSNTEARNARGFDMKAAELVVKLMETDVARARQVAAEAGITLDEAQQAVTDAEIAAGYAQSDENMAGTAVTRAELRRNRAGLAADEAGYNVTEANIAGRAADMPPVAGQVRYRDPYTGQAEWLTPAERDSRQLDYEIGQGQARVGRTSGNSPLAAMPTAGLLNMYGIQTVQPGGSISDTQIQSELVRRLVQQGYTMSQAQQEAQRLIATEMQSREDARLRAERGRRSTGPTELPSR